jgi:hypothetical protein
MFDDRDPDGTARLITEWQADFEGRAERARELGARLAAVTASARSADKLVAVTIDSAGDVIDLQLAEGIRDRPAASTAREIREVLRAAGATLAASAAEVAAETVGADSLTGMAVIASYASRVCEPGE